MRHSIHRKSTTGKPISLSSSPKTLLGRIFSLPKRFKAKIWLPDFVDPPFRALPIPVRNRVIARPAIWATVGLILCSAPACSISTMYFEMNADIQREAQAEVIFPYFDPEIMESALASNIMIAEVGLKHAPDYEPALLLAIEYYAGYGFYWLTDKKERAEIVGDMKEVERIQKRTGQVFDRAATHGRALLRTRDEEFDKALGTGWDAVAKWVAENFDDKEDAEVLAITGLGFAVPILSSSNTDAAFADRPLAEIVLKRSIFLDPLAQNGRALEVLGLIECATPKAAGGKPEQGYEQLKQAMKITKRQSLELLVLAAERCAVALQDRKLFRSLLTEVVNAPDHAKFRLWNTFSRNKAQRLLSQENDLFFE